MKLLKYILCAVVGVSALFPTLAQNQRFNVYTGDQLLFSVPVSQMDSVSVRVIPDTQSPYLVNPTGYFYSSINEGRSIVLEFNEPVFRHNGAITFAITGNNTNLPYAQGTIDQVEIDENRVTITLPEEVAFDETLASSYVLLEIAANAFVDEYNNYSEAMTRENNKAIYWSSTNTPIEIAGIIGNYSVSGVSLFDDTDLTWTCQIVRDAYRENIVWFSSLFPNGQYLPVYGTVSEDLSSITVEADQYLTKDGSIRLDFLGVSNVAVCNNGTIQFVALGAMATGGYYYAMAPVILTRIEE